MLNVKFHKAHTENYTASSLLVSKIICNITTFSYVLFFISYCKQTIQLIFVIYTNNKYINMPLGNKQTPRNKRNKQDNKIVKPR